MEDSGWADAAPAYECQENLGQECLVAGQQGLAGQAGGQGLQQQEEKDDVIAIVTSLIAMLMALLGRLILLRLSLLMCQHGIKP